MEKLVDKVKRERESGVLIMGDYSSIDYGRNWKQMKSTSNAKYFTLVRKPSEYRLRMDEWRSGVRENRPAVELAERVVLPSRRTYDNERKSEQVSDSPPRKKGTAAVLQKQSEESLEVHVASVVVVPTHLQIQQQEVSEKQIRERIVQRMTTQGQEEGSSRMEVSEREVIEVQCTSKSSEDYFFGPMSKQYQEMEKVRNKGSQKVHKLMQERLYAIMDVEGVDPNLVEIAVILCTREEIKGVKLLHLKTADNKALSQGSRYCHGIDAKVLREIATHHQSEALDE
jgi:hypothetical protein